MSDALQVFEQKGYSPPQFRGEGAVPKFAYFAFEHTYVEEELLDPANGEDAADILAVIATHGEETVPLKQALEELGLEE